ncbi:WD40 repeat domain-containing protein [Rhodococcus qingshengii]|uniref:WD40 repeat domain-containing protein n=1 Tax=Rhodococcus qingshengii TaxID=334542 RepID=UPI001ADFE727|nr:WD40 repeat domain-containing protein [Rhodococcus qingshengii]
MPAIDVLYLADDQELVQPLIEALRRYGLDIHERHPGERATDSQLLVVLLTERLVASFTNPAKQLPLEITGYSEVVPVSYFPSEAPVLQDLNHNLIRQVGTDESARRIAAIARFGGRRIVQWNALVDRAQAWKSSADEQKLLDSNELTQALLLLQGSTSIELGPNRELTGSYIEASAKRLKKRRRTRGTAASAATIVLIVALVAAVLQWSDARNARIRADEANAISTADRLSGTAIALKDGDPDLPSLLVERASSLADTDAVRSATTEVAGSTWPHTSMSLDFSPTMITSSYGSNRVAVVSSDDLSIRVIDTDTFAEVSRLSCCRNSDDQPLRAFLDDSGDRLLVSSPGEGRAFVTPTTAPDSDQASVPNLDTDDVLLGWWNSDHLLIGRAGDVLTVDPESGATATVLSMPTDSAIRAIGRSPDRKFLTVTNQDSIVLFDVENNILVRTFDEKSVTALSINNAGDFLYGSRYPTGVAISIGETPEDDETSSNDYTSVSAQSVGDDYVVSGSNGGGLAVIGRGMDYPLAQVRAHRSDGVRMASASDGRLATVSYDGYLRLWEIPDERRMGTPLPFGLHDQSITFADTAGVDIPPRASSRNQIRVSAEGMLAATMLPGYAWILDSETLASTRNPYFSGLNTETFVSRNGRFISTVTSKGVSVAEYSNDEQFWDPDTFKKVPGDPPKMSVAGTGTGIAAVSDDGHTVTIADEYQVSAWSMRSEAIDGHAFSDPRTPIALFAAESGIGYALNEQGGVRGSDGTESSLITAFTELESPIAGADITSTDSYTVVTKGGTVLQQSPGRDIRRFDVSSGLDPFTVRISPAGNLIAILGRNGLVVIDTEAGSVRFREAAAGAAYVSDIVLYDNDNEATAVTALGSVRTIDLDKSTPAITSPRPPTLEEAASLRLEVDQSNG